MVVRQNEAEFLRQQAKRLRLLAKGCTPGLGEEILRIAADFERRASLIDGEDKND